MSGLQAGLRTIPFPLSRFTGEGLGEGATTSRSAKGSLRPHLERCTVIFKHVVMAGGAWLAACLPGLSQAADDTIYKSIGLHGEVTYSSHPQPGAVRTEAIKVDTLSPEQQRAALQLRMEEQKAEQKSEAEMQAREARWQRADQEIKDAIAAVQKAEADLESGREPLPGERLGMQGGGSRLTQAYFDRIHGLELAVEAAKLRLDKAYQARNALR
jgi:hypothetical protein